MKKILTLMTLVGLLSIPIAAMSTKSAKFDQTQITSIVPAIVDSGGVIALALLSDKSAVKMMKNVALDTGQSAVPIAFAVYYVTDTGQVVPLTAVFVTTPVKQTSPAATIPIQIAGLTTYPSISEIAARAQVTPWTHTDVAVKSEPFQLEQPVAVRRV